jgi:DnaJ family protein C protein 17
LTTPSSLSTLLNRFGATDADSIVLSIKPPKKAPEKPPKFATALVSFKQIGDAFAAVCASGRTDRGLDRIEVGWAEGKEPEILCWLKKMGKLGGVETSKPVQEERSEKEQAQLPQVQTRRDSSVFSSFPESMVSLSLFSFRRSEAPSQPEIPPTLPSKTATVTGIDYESLTLMRLRQAEREKLERSIREQEGDA